MMFNGLLICGDSDNSEFTKDSHGATSVAESGADSGAGSGQCSAVTRALHYHDKLMATLRILENKDEMIRVQADSLKLAESRIAALTARATDLRQELQDKANELRFLQTTDCDKVLKSSVSVTADVEEHQRIVSTLEGNLSVIEELYRECFYEAAKQEKLIEMLRSDILDVRLLEKQKETQIQKLQNVVHTQKWSLDQCQDIAMEVDNLKMEISNFLNSSNNDSGMWERDSSPSQGDAVEDLREISTQLLQLRDMLTVDCTCGLEKENMRLKQENATMQLHIAELEQRLSQREAELAEKEITEQRHNLEIESKEKEISNLRQELEAQDRSSKELSGECETLSRQVKQAEVLLGDKSAELTAAQRQCQELKEELQQRAADLVKENTKIRDEVCELHAQVAMWRQQLVDSERATRALQEQLQRARELCRDVDRSYQEKARCASSLQSQLDEAQERGAVLCDDTRGVLDAVRRWTCAARNTRREQENKIKEQEKMIKSLQQRLSEKSTDGIIDDPCSSTFIPRPRSRKHLESTDRSTDPCCSKCIPRPRSQKVDLQEIRLSSCSRICGRRESATEMASCSSGPVPPLRTGRKKFCQEMPSVSSFSQHSAQCPGRCDGCSVSHTRARADTTSDEADVRHVTVNTNPFRQRPLSPTSSLEARVCELQDALSRRQRRWARARSASHTR